MLTFDELFQRLNEQDESVEIEAKTAQQMGNSILETICAFSNEPNRGGGYILLGVRREPDSLFPGYEVVGISSPDTMQSDLVSQCASVFSAVVRPQVECSNRPDGKVAIAVYVPEAPQHDKPVYIKSKGLPRGAFRRIGSTDVVCTDDDIQALYQDRGHRGFDEGVVDNCTIEDLDAKAIQEYRRIRAEANPHAPELEYDYIRNDSWTEKVANSAAPANRFASGHDHALDIPVGLRANKAFALANGGVIIPEIRASYVYTANKSVPTIQSGFAGAPGTMTMRGVDPGRSHWRFGAGLSGQINRRVDFHVEYEFEARSGYKGHNVNASVGVSF